jgi:hypothetical protein
MYGDLDRDWAFAFCSGELSIIPISSVLQTGNGGFPKMILY